MEKRWYIIRTYVGHEHRVKAALERKIRESANAEKFGEIVIPTEMVFGMVRGKRRTMEHRLFPGYLLAEIALDEESRQLIRSVPRVVGFLGEAETPTTVPEKEVQEIIARVNSSRGTVRPRSRVAIGEQVRVVDGPFREFSGTVEAVRPDASRVRVALSVFGRPTPVELDLVEVEAA